MNFSNLLSQLAGDGRLPLSLPNIAINYITFFLLFALVGCTHQDENRQPPLPRPVKAFRITDQSTKNDSQFPGEVRARFEMTLSFRVAGKIITRAVDIGEHVHKGQLLARLAPNDYQLAEQSLKAQLISAEADRKFSKDDLDRYQELLTQNIISQPELDRRRTQYINAQQKVTALQSQLNQAANQLAYTELLAERDGVITALEVETGQVVTVGQPIIKLTRLDEKEIHIDIPEHRVAGIALYQEVGVTLWADGDKQLKGRIRELAAAADPLSRTYRAKVTLLENSDNARFGMTATVWIPSNTPSNLAIPLSAVFTSQNRPGQTSVWLVDEHSSTVKAVPVQIGVALPGDRTAVTGLAAGQLIVSAGVNRLIEGQTVRLPQQAKTNVDASEESR
jgi:multidrug efflux system membrane fusion protein